MSTQLLQLKGIKKVFHTEHVETHALSKVTLSIAKGDFVSISGPSGCGKSTLLSIIGLLDTISEGVYELSGHNVSSISVGERAKIRNREIGFIFQSFNLISELTVEENAVLPLTYRGDLSQAECDALTKEALEKVDMVHRAKHYPSQLSGGQQQRVAVARAVVGKPNILLADEPTGNLDTRNAEAVLQLLENFHKNGATICMVTHDPRAAERADRVIDLLDGQVVADKYADQGLVDTAIAVDTEVVVEAQAS